MKFLLLLSCFVLMTLSVFGQTKISGKISGNDNNEPLVGASVVAQGTSIGTVSDLDGNFSLEVPAKTTTLVVSFVGYRLQEVAIKNQTVINVTMEVNTNLNEVVVVGYGTQTKKELTGSVSKVSGDVISQIPVVGIDAALQGQASGVQVFTNSGTPGGAISVRVRGPSSINGSSQPLYVVDGIPISTGSLSQLGVGNQQTNALSDINPSDIESIEILKDAASAAIYGARANNGVVLITTKRGKIGKPKIELKTEYGNQQVWRKLSTITGPQYGTLVNEERTNRGQSILFPDPTTLPTTNWQDQIFRNAQQSNTQGSISGGTEKARYYIGGSYFNQDGIVLGSNFNRITGRMNLDNYLTDNLKLTISANYSQTGSSRLNNDNNIYGVVSAAILEGSHIPVYNTDGTFARDPNSSVENPVAAAILPEINYSDQRLVANAALEWKIIEGLYAKTSFGTDNIAFRDFRFYPNNSNAGFGVGGQATEAFTRVVDLINENTLRYTTNFDKLKIDILGGISFQNEKYSYLYAQGEKFPGNTIRTLDAASVKKDIQSTATQYGINSYFGRLGLSWNKKYNIQAVLRDDESSRFGTDKRAGIFPGISGSWVISEEPFMKGISNVVSSLKIKGGWGLRGSSDIGNFSSRGLIAAGANYNSAPGLAPIQLANNALGWEQREDYSGGIEIGFAKDRLTISVEPYKAFISSVLLQTPIAATTGFTSLAANKAKMENTGIDFGFKAVTFDTKMFKWTTTINAAVQSNIVTDYPSGQPFGFASWLEKGYSIGSFRGYQVAGIFQSQAEIDALDKTAKEKFGASAVYQTTLTKPGDIKFVDINGDGHVTAADQTILGNALPKWYGGITNELSLDIPNIGRFDLSVLLSGSFGNKIFNFTRAFSEGMNSVFGQTDAVLNRWTPTNTNTDIPRAVFGDPNQNRRNSDRWVEDGSYVRLRTITLSYSLPTTLFTKIGIQTVRVYASGLNLWTATNYKGFDPEVSTFAEGVGANANAAIGTDFLTYPQAKSLIFGINVGF